MTAPLIGITTYARNEENIFTLPAEYVDAVRRAGGIPVLLPPGETLTADLLARLDGLILAGGGDVDPQLYHGMAHETIYSVNEERDATELKLTKEILASDTPLLCICRGAQVLNVALGGTLIEHLPDEVGDTIIHRNPPDKTSQHPVTIDPDSKLAQIIGQTETGTTSWHHQAVRQLAPGLKTAALAPDGTIEALEMPSHPWLVAVQWHPEITAHTDPAQQRIFDALIKAAQTKSPRF